jgi:hypothetical protein
VSERGCEGNSSAPEQSQHRQRRKKPLWGGGSAALWLTATMHNPCWYYCSPRNVPWE